MCHGGYLGYTTPRRAIMTQDGTNSVAYNRKRRRFRPRAIACPCVRTRRGRVCWAANAASGASTSGTSTTSRGARGRAPARRRRSCGRTPRRATTPTSAVGWTRTVRASCAGSSTVRRWNSNCGDCVALPGKFENVKGLENLADWSLSISGGRNSSAYTVAVKDGRVFINRRGLTIILR